MNGLTFHFKPCDADSYLQVNEQSQVVIRSKSNLKLSFINRFRHWHRLDDFGHPDFFNLNRVIDALSKQCFDADKPLSIVESNLKWVKAKAEKHNKRLDVKILSQAHRQLHRAKKSLKKSNNRIRIKVLSLLKKFLVSIQTQAEKHPNRLNNKIIKSIEPKLAWIEEKSEDYRTTHLIFKNSLDKPPYLKCDIQLLNMQIENLERKKSKLELSEQAERLDPQQVFSNSLVWLKKMNEILKDLKSGNYGFPRTNIQDKAIDEFNLNTKTSPITVAVKKLKVNEDDLRLAIANWKRLISKIQMSNLFAPLKGLQGIHKPDEFKTCIKSFSEDKKLFLEFLGNFISLILEKDEAWAVNGKKENRLAGIVTVIDYCKNLIGENALLCLGLYYEDIFGKRKSRISSFFGF